MRDVETIDAQFEGCWFDSCRGFYIGEAVQAEALAWGWEGYLYGREVVSADLSRAGEYEAESYHEAWDEATTYLDNLAPEGFYFGSNDSGDWGLWRYEEE